jgi:hypothetical protein
MFFSWQVDAVLGSCGVGQCKKMRCECPTSRRRPPHESLGSDMDQKPETKNIFKVNVQLNCRLNKQINLILIFASMK